MIHSHELVENHNKFRRISLFIVTLIIFSFNFFIPVSANNADITAERLLNGHNTIRQENGLNAFVYNAALESSAQSKAVEMLNNDCWDHYCPNGISPWTFFENSGYSYIFAGENLAEGFINTRNVMTAWMNSPTHKENIVRPEFTEIGFGIITGNYQGKENNTIVVVHFGTPKSSAQISSNQINILNPVDGTVVTSLPLSIQGTSNSEASFSVDLNGVETVYQILNQDFSILINELELGQNQITFSSTDPNTIITPSDLIINYNQQSAESIQTSGISLDLKNNINLIFVVLVIVIFIGDLLLVYKTNIGNKNSSLNHFHLGLFIILGIIVISGGIFGNILQGINS